MGRQPEELSQHRCPICSFRWHEIVTAVVVISVAVDQVARAPDVLLTGGTDAAHDPVPGTSAQVFENEQRTHTATDAANVAQESEPRGVAHGLVVPCAHLLQPLHRATLRSALAQHQGGESAGMVHTPRQSTSALAISVGSWCSENCAAV
ncbi:unnamed protein product [Allacma fusca]|uniref:Uncharacterized protein n=1 Tax=Allacma fusca TaxID=39272 RepID=A0A8J2K162_9HEXA|nr:unnamed protein product [Allacma fusca]